MAKQADDDQWHETIMLAAGTHTGGVHFGRSLVEGLLKRGERHKSRRQSSQRRRKTCFALALGCLENLRQHDEALRERVLAHLDDLVPPRTTEDAKILSVAGDAVVPHLEYTRWKDERTSTVEACAEALVQIGTASATKALLETYGLDQREPVIARVCQCPNVDLSAVPLVARYVDEHGSLPRYAYPSSLNSVRRLSGLKQLEFTPITTNGFDVIPSLADLDTVKCSEMPLCEVGELLLPTSLDAIYLLACLGNDLAWLERFSRLRKLGITLCHEIGDLAILKQLAYLEKLRIQMFDKEVDLALIAESHSLKRLCLLSCKFMRPRAVCSSSKSHPLSRGDVFD